MFGKKMLIFVLLVGVVFLVSACATGSGSSVSVSSESIDSSSASTDYGSYSGELKVFRINAFRYAFDPDVIEVNQGDKVRIIAKSLDGAHGFAIPDFGVNLYLDGSGEEQVAEFVADRKGSFPFYCSVFCGSGHSDMRGVLVVK